jgi:hypothetical protein
VTFDLAIVLLALGDSEASRLYAGEALNALTKLMRAAAGKELGQLAGAYTPNKPWPDKRRLRRYRPENSVRPAVALDWLKLGLAVSELTRDRWLVLDERRKVFDRSLYAVELQADGSPSALPEAASTQ